MHTVPVGMVKTDVNAQFCSYCPLDTIVNNDGTACLAEDCPQYQAKTRTGVCQNKTFGFDSTLDFEGLTFANTEEVQAFIAVPYYDYADTACSADKYACNYEPSGKGKCDYSCRPLDAQPLVIPGESCQCTSYQVVRHGEQVRFLPCSSVAEFCDTYMPTAECAR